MSQQAHTPSNAPAPTAKNKTAKGATLLRATAKVAALNPDAANQSETGPKKYKAHMLGFDSRRKSWMPITNSTPSALPKKAKGISDHSIGGTAAAPASKALGPDKAPAIRTPTIIHRQNFIAL